MENLGISFRWGEAKDPQVGVNLTGCEGTEELKEVILVIKNSLEENFPGVPVILRGKAGEIFREVMMRRLIDEEGEKHGTLQLPLE